MAKKKTAKKRPAKKKKVAKRSNKYMPTRRQRMAVTAMRKGDMAVEEIGSILGIDRRTVLKHFKKEIGSSLPGAPKFEPTEDDRKKVKAMAGYGLNHKEIASLITNPRTERHISRQTLENEFSRELEIGVPIANSQVAQSLYRKAIGNGSQAVTAAIWWTKVRMGWRGESLELTGKDGGPIETVSTDAPKARLEALIMKQREAAIAGADGAGGNGRLAHHD